MNDLYPRSAVYCNIWFDWLNGITISWCLLHYLLAIGVCGDDKGRTVCFNENIQLACSVALEQMVHGYSCVIHVIIIYNMKLTFQRVKQWDEMNTSETKTSYQCQQKNMKLTFQWAKQCDEKHFRKESFIPEPTEQHEINISVRKTMGWNEHFQEENFILVPTEQHEINISACKTMGWNEHFREENFMPVITEQHEINISANKTMGWNEHFWEENFMPVPNQQHKINISASKIIRWNEHFSLGKLHTRVIQIIEVNLLESRTLHQFQQFREQWYDMNFSYQEII